MIPKSAKGNVMFMQQLNKQAKIIVAPMWLFCRRVNNAHNCENQLRYSPN